jgi:hypothetical protein
MSTSCIRNTQLIWSAFYEYKRREVWHRIRTQLWLIPYVDANIYACMFGSNDKMEYY